MEHIDLEETRRESESEIWPQYRHVSEQRLHAFRFSLGFLGALSVVLIVILLYGAGPRLCAAFGGTVSALCIAFAALDRRMAVHQTRLEISLHAPEEVGNGEAKPRKRGRAGAASDPAGGRSVPWEASPFLIAYAAFGLFGAFSGTLPFWDHAINLRPLAQTPGSQSNPSTADRGSAPVTPIPRPPTGIYREAPHFGAQQGAGAAPYPTPWFNRFPLKTPSVAQPPVASPAIIGPPLSPAPVPVLAVPGAAGAKANS